nr:50S ribosomal protein L16 [Flexistipes sinusarabici]
MKGKATKGNSIEFGEYGLQATQKGKITSRQIEAARIAINRSLRRGGKVFIRIFPHKPITQRPAETRMGKGKGAVEFYVAPIKEGTILYEVRGVSEEKAQEALRLASHKLPVKCKFVRKSQVEGGEE